VHDGEKTPEKMAGTDNLRVKEIFLDKGNILISKMTLHKMET
jgi:hypothetical protein